MAVIDRKTIRGNKNGSHKAYHIISAFAAENQLVLGELVTEEKSNEITAVFWSFWIRWMWQGAL